jgi:hypothetical protein
MSPPVIIGAIFVLVAGLVVYAVWQTISARTASSQPIEGLETFPNLSGDHVDGVVNYEQTPPVGGPHNAIWQNCGVYAEPVANENAVHALEHGAVWITYQPDLPADQVAALQQFTRQSGYRLLSPFPDLPSPVVASAWGYQVKLDSADDPRLQRFVQRYEQNPLGPEPGASCSGGVGQPS